MRLGALGKLYKSGETIVRQGDAGHCMYIVQQGHLEVRVKDEGGEVILARLGPGDVFGEMALFTKEPRSATVRALNKARVLTIDKRGFFRRIHEDPTLAFRILRKLSERIQHDDKQLEHLAIRDGLTGLYNHRFFHDRLDEEFARTIRYGAGLSCLIIDMDEFGHINEVHGHRHGDGILRAAADRLSKNVRRCDILSHYGGETFAVILPATALDGGAAEAERIRQDMADIEYQGLPEDTRLTVSIGVAAYAEDATPTGDALLHAASTALQDAKKQGGDCVVLAQRR